MKQTVFPVLLLIFLVSSIVSEESGSPARSAIQFRDTTGTDKTAKIGWTGSAESGHFFVQTPNEGKVLRSNSEGIEVDGTVKADKFSGDGSGLTDLPKSSVGVDDVSGLKDALAKKADAGALSGKADTGWVKTKLEGKAGTADVNGKLGGKADTGWVKTKVNDAVSSVSVSADAIDSSNIVGGGISGSDINPEAKVKVGGLTVGGNLNSLSLNIVGGGTYEPGSIFSDANWGMIFRSRQADPLKAQYRWADSEDNELMRIGNNGDVGVGTSAPSAKLDISGPYYQSVYASGFRFIPCSKYNGNRYLGFTQDSIDYDLFMLQTYSTSDNLARGKLVFQHLAGNVGIGTSTPNSKLDVKGILEVGAASRGMKITSNAQDNFQLLTHTNTPNPNITIGYGDGAGGVDDSKEHIFVNNGRFLFKNGNVGIGTTTPGYSLDVNGTIRSDNVSASSDRRYKTSITPLSSSLEKITALQGVTYFWDRASFPHKNFTDRQQVGLIAQDVEKVIPEVVSTDNQGYKSLAYDRLVPVLIEAVKEQKQIVDDLRAENSSLRERLEKIEERLGLK